MSAVGRARSDRPSRRAPGCRRSPRSPRAGRPPGWSGARARTLAAHRPDDSFLVRLARAWWFGRLPHETLAACEATPPTPSRQTLAEALLDRPLPELRRLASRLSTPLDHDLPGGPASPRQVAEVLAELAERHGLSAELAALLGEDQRPRA